MSFTIHPYRVVKSSELMERSEPASFVLPDLGKTWWVPSDNVCRPFDWVKFAAGRDFKVTLGAYRFPYTGAEESLCSIVCNVSAWSAQLAVDLHTRHGVTPGGIQLIVGDSYPLITDPADTNRAYARGYLGFAFHE